MLGFRVTMRIALIALAVIVAPCHFGAPAYAQSDDPLTLLGQVTALSREGKLTEAIEVSKRLLTALEKMAGKQHPLYLAQIASLGDLHAMKGDNAEAERLNLHGPDHPDVAKSLNNLADAMTWLDMPDEAERLFRRSLAIRERGQGADDLSVAVALDNLAALLLSRKRYAEAETLARRSLAIHTEKQPADHPDLALSLGNLATILGDLGRHAEARELHQRSLDIKTASLGGHHPELAKGHRQR